MHVYTVIALLVFFLAQATYASAPAAPEANKIAETSDPKITQKNQKRETTQTKTSQLSASINELTSAIRDSKPNVSLENEEEKKGIERKALKADEKIADETEKLANYTNRLAYLTCLLVAVGSVQIGLFFWQLLLMRKAVKDGTIVAETARKEFIATHRPKIIVRRFFHQDLGGDEDSVDIGCEIVNIGESLATVVWWSLRMWRHPSSQPLPGNPPYAERIAQSIPIDNGMLVPLPSLRAAGFHFESGGEEESGEEGSWLILGYVEYEDINEKLRRTAFLRRYNPQSNSFVIVPHADYEYQD